MTLIRPSQTEDIPAIAAIYARHVLHGTGTFEIDPPSPDDMAQRRVDVLAKGLPYLVAAKGDQVMGFAYCNWFKPRPAYRFSAEDSIYLADEAIGQGLGRALLAELMAQAEKAGVRKLIAVIGDSANHGSIGVHRSAGFSMVGVLKSCGWKFDQWLDVVMMDKALGLGATRAPQT
ncbi:GCN5-related N-acetyltransferase [Rhodoferax ferrireducens T118]|uniref:GCN5-related N-acetyltransferase n=1 Tax=Albidiferax ferrireducens (strain ATCC BAA-621 / DSM 15236 / T118) TaxID=338969 RepID=Q21YL9_ALBFT|nr:GNAT family N-acetyltransferase [Rhodoferax ferrireducens]ABD69134.1 GCN5-related N-acetyltransferase [Rhodoferax ferrireducens T118]WPC68242.1 N-acetyltransferase family protein [Rhodoferax ferrireducens]